ncbi:hypothetical protein K0E75_10665 [Bacteroides fragilis]|uniref:hypothetical protein n=1 Tax=Bacteroides TaxID=816 RepID=UPI0020308CDD|nr:hypothetical protein [Bacteroides fragilis]MCE8587980.1 hypothetical protein [Bacteroides fragilis]MCE8592119.1 hypothetical protein [Bacteroides fragilis]MCE8656970.1 hypothetical protein [Bacteroides fragilis]MCE8662201.1 hypothetical protein [Bacteroides fragilis]MCM0263918.1 hypothetical protein [Bacteroides fragilis]
MKRYNKQQVMRDAHKLYRNDFQRRGRSWGECLKATWRWEKDAVKTREEKNAKLDAMIAASWAAYHVRENEKINRNEFEGLLPDAVSFAMGYGRGNGFYCGD